MNLDRTYRYAMEDGTTLTVSLESINQPVLPDTDENEWNKLNDEPISRKKIVAQVRYMVRKHPNLKRALSLYLMYVVGKDLTAQLVPDLPPDFDDTEENNQRIEDIRFYSQKVWRKFLRANKGSWSVSEFYKRLLRDGEVFNHRTSNEWPTEVRFIDPEDIDDGAGDTGTKGINTLPNDVTVPTSYDWWNSDEGRLIQQIPAEFMYHAKIDVDANEKRGRSRFEPIIDTSVMLEAMVRNEVAHRNAQSSIVLVRKVAGTRTDAASVVDNAKTGQTTRPDGISTPREKFRSGTILTVSKGVDIEFAQPQSNFSDASPLLKLLLQQISAATGWSYSQLTADASEGNFASALVAESPVYQMVESEREFLANELNQLATDVFIDAVQAGEIEGLTQDELLNDWRVEFSFQDIVSRDRIKEAQAANLATMQRAISKAEFGRRVGADPQQMAREIERELQRDVERMGMMGSPNDLNPSNTIPDPEAMAASSAANAAGGGTNQDNGADSVNHSDSVA